MREALKFLEKCPIIKIETYFPENGAIAVLFLPAVAPKFFYLDFFPVVSYAFFQWTWKSLKASLTY